MVQQRIVLSLMGNVCLICTYMSAFNINTAILDEGMDVEVLKSATNFSEPELLSSNSTQNETSNCKNDNSLKGTLIGAFFYGYVATHILGSWLSIKFGCKKVLLVNTALTGLCSLIFPSVAKVSLTGAIVVRVLTGIFAGPAIPVTRGSLGPWAPHDEYGRLVSLQIIGCPIGICLTQGVGGFISQYLGWPAIFYITAGCCLLWCGLWLILISDRPEDHSRISEKEREHILKFRSAESNSSSSKTTPWLKILTSKHVIALLIGQITNQWGVYLAFSVFPIILSKAKEYSFSSGTVGLITALTGVTIVISGSISIISDRIVKNRGKNFARKSFCVIGGCIAALFFILFYFFGHNPFVGVTFIFIATFAIGVESFVALEPNSVDLNPRYASIIQSIVNSGGNCAGFVVPTLAFMIAGCDDQNLDGWNRFILVSAAVISLGAFIFLIFGTADEQTWKSNENESSKKKNSKDDEVFL